MVSFFPTRSRRQVNTDLPPAYVEKASDDTSTNCTVAIQPLPTNNGLILKVDPIARPSGAKRANVDVVLVLDTSGSMDDVAPMPKDANGNQLEATGLRILDLVKHAAKAVLETLHDNDRLAIVSFSSEAEIRLQLCAMTPGNKERARKAISDLYPNGCTAMWAGLQKGLEQFQIAGDIGNVPALALLTDGQPMGHNASPEGGWKKKLSSLRPFPAAVHTFGFGNNLQGGLLPTISELGGGKYSFISDLGMIGTAVIHATAGIQSSLTANARLILTGPRDIPLEASWSSMSDLIPTEMTDGSLRYDIDLGTIHYGQPRHLYFRYEPSHDHIEKLMRTESSLPFEASLSFNSCRDTHQSSSYIDLVSNNTHTLSDTELAYHRSRYQFADFLSQLFPVTEYDGRSVLSVKALTEAQNNLTKLQTQVPASQTSNRRNAQCSALLKDFKLPYSSSEVEQALSPGNWIKWGRHYLPSLMCAHVNQSRLTFKDPGTQVYGGALFEELVTSLSAAFENLPAPVARPRVDRATGQTFHYSRANMKSLNCRDNGCFAPESKVLMADGTTRLAIKDVTAGMAVQTLAGERTVKAVIKFHSDPSVGRVMCRVRAQDGRELTVTPWHPVSLDGRRWEFPAQVEGMRAEVGFAGCVYTLLLERAAECDAASINVNGVWGVTLGHGLTMASATSGVEDVRAHAFFGDHERIVAALKGMPTDANGTYLIDGVDGQRDAVTGMVSGFTAYNGGMEAVDANGLPLPLHCTMIGVEA